MKRKASERIFLILLVGLLVLRFPVLLIPHYGLLPISKETALMFFENGTCLLTAIMVLLKRDALADYHIDRFALVLLTLAPIGLCLSEYLLRGWEHVQLSGWVNAGISIGLLLALLVWKPALPKRGAGKTLLWVGIAIAVGLLWSVVAGYLIHLQRGAQSLVGMALPQMIFRAFVAIFIQLGNAATIEEPLFRGFLWGFLKERRWKEKWIWLFQALLFMLGHIYYLGSANYSFFLVVPLGALLLGWMAWRSGSIGTSMIVHGIGNSLAGNLFSFLRW